MKLGKSNKIQDTDFWLTLTTIGLIANTGCMSSESNPTSGTAGFQENAIQLSSNESASSTTTSEQNSSSLNQYHSKTRVHMQSTENQPTYTSAKIKILELQFHSLSEDRWYRLPIQPSEIDLIALGSEANGIILSKAKAPAGIYDQIRLLTEETGTIGKTDGTVRILKVPSGPQTGIKLHFNEGLILKDCNLTDAHLQIDLSKSFVENAQGVNFKPVVHVLGSAPIDLGTQCAVAEEPNNPADSDTGNSDNIGGSNDDTNTGSENGTDGTTDNSGGTGTDEGPVFDDGTWGNVIGI